MCVRVARVMCILPLKTRVLPFGGLNDDNNDTTYDDDELLVGSITKSSIVRLFLYDAAKERLKRGKDPKLARGKER